MKILHQKFKVGEMSPEDLLFFHEQIQNAVGDDVIVISSPLEIKSLTGTILIDDIEVSVDDIRELKNKHR